MNTHYVKAGESLSILAPILLGPGASWQDLWSHNPQISNPDVLEIGDPVFYPKNSAEEPSGSIPPVLPITKKPVIYAAVGVGALMLIALAFTLSKR